MKRVEVTVSFDVPSLYRWTEISDRVIALHDAAKLLALLTDVDIVSVEVNEIPEPLEDEP